MKKEDLVGLGLDENQVNEVFKMRGKEIEASKLEVSELEQAKLALESERDEALSKVSELEASSVNQEDYNKLKESNSEFENKISELKGSHSKEIETIQYNHILDNAIKLAGARKPEYVRSALNEEILKFEDGEIEGLNEELERIKGEDGFLFADNTKINYTTGSSGSGAGKLNPFEAAANKIIGK